MSWSEMVAFMQENPYIRITHRLFSSEEYIYSLPDGCVYDENGYLFEDWDSFSQAHIGLRMRRDGVWSDGWEIKKEI